MPYDANSQFTLRGDMQSDDVNLQPTVKQSIDAFGEPSSEESALIRLLLGTLIVRDNVHAEEWGQDVNFAVLGCPLQKVHTQEDLKGQLAGLEIDFDELNNYLRRSLKQRLFYKDLFLEVLYFFSRERASQNCLAFVHIYRFLERVSFVFPVIYASASHDFKGTYDSLKEYLTGDKKKGELGFFRNFLNVALDKTLLDSTAILNFDHLDAPERDKAALTIRRLVAKEAIVSDADGRIEISNRAVLGLLIDLRNRFFHFASGNSENISLVEMSNPDGFFEGVNRALLNWLSVIYFMVLRKMVERYN